MERVTEKERNTIHSKHAIYNTKQIGQMKMFDPSILNKQNILAR